MPIPNLPTQRHGQAGNEMDSGATQELEDERWFLLTTRYSAGTRDRVFRLLVLACLGFLASCGGASAGSSVCDPGRVSLDGSCIAQPVADFIMCIRSRGNVELVGERAQKFSAEAKVAGQGAGTAVELRDSLKAKYSTEGGEGTEQAIVERCAEIVGANQAQTRSGGHTPEVAEAALNPISSNAILHEDFSGYRPGSAPPGWLGVDGFAVTLEGGGRGFRCTERGAPRFVIPLQNELPSRFQIDVMFSRTHRFDGVGIEVGGLKAGFIWSRAYLGKSEAWSDDAKGTQQPVTDMTLTLERIDGVNRLLYDGREVLINRADIQPTRNLILSLDHNAGPINCPGGAVLKRIDILPR
jgi:hypothetical protein